MVPILGAIVACGCRSHLELPVDLPVGFGPPLDTKRTVTGSRICTLRDKEAPLAAEIFPADLRCVAAR